jgi:hypothetical protein
MSGITYPPPNPYFSGINFNPSFFSIISTYLTETIANSKYLRLIGGVLTGNLGIKKTPVVELDVNGKAFIDNGFATFPGNGVLGSNGTRLILFPGTATETPFALGYSANEIWYGTRSGGTHLFFTGTTERVRINNAQMTLNTNINLKMTQAILDLSDATVNTPIYLATAGAALLGTANSSGQYSTSAATGDTILRGQAGKKFILQSGAGAAAMTILDTANIGIGITDPGSRFEVNGAISSLGTDAVIYVGGVGTGAALCQAAAAGSFSTSAEIGDAVIRSQSTKKLLLQSGSGAANIVITNTGNVGIGTTDPLTRLHTTGKVIINNGSATLPINGVSGGDGTRLILFPGTASETAFALGISADTLWYGVASTANHVFYTGTTERMKIRNTGNVGIGTNNPNNILQVGDGARLRISNGTTDYSMIGTKQVDDNDNTRIVLSGNTRTGNTGNIDYTTTSTGAHRFNNGATEIVRITSAGRVGIGATNPQALLQVAPGGTSTGSITQRYFSAPINITTTTTATTNVCAIFDSSLWCKDIITSSSDERIKTNITDINDDTALQKILQIEPKTYKYINKVEKSSNLVYGFIAQQIKEVIPEAVKLEKSIIPNIYKLCNYDNDIITIPDGLIDKLKVNDEIEIITKDEKRNKCSIIEINENDIKINESLNPEYNQCFIIGSNVDDFHTLDKNYIFTLNISATQELHRLIQELRLTLAEQRERISILENNTS